MQHDRNNKKNKITLSGEDIKEGLNCSSCQLKCQILNFHLKLKDKLVSSEIRHCS